MISCLFLPSNETHAEFLLEGATSIWNKKLVYACMHALMEFYVVYYQSTVYKFT